MREGMTKSEYAAFCRQVAREGADLLGPVSEDWSDEEWDDRFDAYRANLTLLRQMGSTNTAVEKRGALGDGGVAEGRGDA